VEWFEGKCNVCGSMFSVPQKILIGDIVKCPQCNNLTVDVRKEKLNFLPLSINGQRKKKKKGGSYINGGAMKLRR